jgi:hypothetical protein
MLEKNVMIKGQITTIQQTVMVVMAEHYRQPEKKCTKQGLSPESHHLSEKNRHV